MPSASSSFPLSISMVTSHLPQVSPMATSQAGFIPRLSTLTQMLPPCQGGRLVERRAWVQCGYAILILALSFPACADHPSLGLSYPIQCETANSWRIRGSLIIATSSHGHFVEGLSFCLELALLRTPRPTLQKVLQDGEDQDRVQGCTDMNLNPGLVRYMALGKVSVSPPAQRGW